MHTFFKVENMNEFLFLIALFEKSCGVINSQSKIESKTRNKEGRSSAEGHEKLPGLRKPHR